jgi:hypothetical protein
VGTGWTPEDDSVLIGNRSNGIPDKLTAQELGRTRKATQARAVKLIAQGLIVSSTYRQGEKVVPCAICGTSIDRTGTGGKAHAKFCSKECKREHGRQRGDAHRRALGQRKTRKDGICPNCGVNPRPFVTSRLRGWCKPCESAQKAEYMRSPAGKATYARWYHSAKGQIFWRLFRERYVMSGTCIDCGKACHRDAERCHSCFLQSRRT